MPNIYIAIRNFLLDLLFPLECLNCRLEGLYLCKDCFQKIKINDKNYQNELKISLRIPHLNEIYIAGRYEDPILNKLIIKYKYNFLSPLGEVLADFLIRFWKEQELNKDVFVVIPIPLSQKRRRWRGFNQAEIIAQIFSTHYHYSLNLNLKRIKHGSPQANLNEVERQKNIQSAYAWAGGNIIGKTILLIDDVTTTGATLNEAARILKKAGADKIIGLVLAKG